MSVGEGVFSRSGGYSDGLFCATAATTPLCCHSSKERPCRGWAGEYRRANYGGFILRWELERLQRSMHWVGRHCSVLLHALLYTHCFSFFCYCRALVGREGRNNLFCFQRRERWQRIQRRWYGDHHAVYLSPPADATAVTGDGSDTRRSGSRGPRCRSRPRYGIIIFIVESTVKNKKKVGDSSLAESKEPETPEPGIVSRSKQ